MYNEHDVVYYGLAQVFDFQHLIVCPSLPCPSPSLSFLPSPPVALCNPLTSFVASTVSSLTSEVELSLLMTFTASRRALRSFFDDFEVRKEEREMLLVSSLIVFG